MFKDKVLPSIYQSIFRSCTNSRESVRRFHAEGRRQYDTHFRITRLENRFAAAGKYVSDKDYTLTQYDQFILKNNLKVVEDIKQSPRKEEKSLKKNPPSRFLKSGKILPGHNCAKTFDKETIDTPRKLQVKAAEIQANLRYKLQKCSAMFKHLSRFKARNSLKTKSKRSSKAERFHGD